MFFYLFSINFARKVLAQTVGPSDTGGLQSVDPVSQGFLESFPWGILGIFFLCLAIFVALIWFLLNYLKKKDIEEKSKDWVLYEVRVPKANELEVGVAERLFANLSGIGGESSGFLGKYLSVKNAISFEIVGLPESIRFYIYCPRKLASWVEKQVLGAYQDADFSEASEYNIFHEEGKVAFASLSLSDETYCPIKTYEDFEGDPLASITSAISKIEKGEGVAIQLVISPAGGDWQKEGRSFVSKVENNNSDPENKRIDVSQEKLQAISKKSSKAGFNCALRIVCVAQNQEIAKMHLDNVVGAFDQFSNSGVNEFKKNSIRKFKEREFMKSFIYRYPSDKKGLVLNVEELATVYHYPNDNVKTPHIHWLLSREAPADSMIPNEGTWLGSANFRGQSKEVFISDEDRFRHVYVIGQTGSGKSYVLQSMALQDAYAGKGLAIIDPHGSMAEYVLKRIPPERAEDVIYFNPADYERPLGFNIMDFFDEQDKHRVVNAFLGLMDKMYDPNNQGITGPRFQQAVRNAMLTAMTRKGSTLIEVQRLLTDEDWLKEEWLPHIEDNILKRYWTGQMAKTTDFHKSEIVGYIVSKFDKFVTNLAMRNIIGQSESSFNMRDVMDDGKILIVNLSKGLIGEENAQLLGLLIVPKILSAALSRENIREEDRNPFYLYVDEFQTFATPDFAQILSEARKYRLSLIVGNQYISQMSDEVRNAIFGNVGSLVTMRVGPDDGKYLESQYEPVFTSNDLINQPNIHACVKLLVNGTYPAPFSMNTRYENDRYPESEEVEKIIKQLSRLRYGKDKNLVEEEISKRSNLASESTSKADMKIPSPPNIPLS